MLYVEFTIDLFNTYFVLVVVYVFYRVIVNIIYIDTPNSTHRIIPETMTINDYIESENVYRSIPRLICIYCTSLLKVLKNPRYFAAERRCDVSSDTTDDNQLYITL